MNRKLLIGWLWLLFALDKDQFQCSIEEGAFPLLGLLLVTELSFNSFSLLEMNGLYYFGQATDKTAAPQTTLCFRMEFNDVSRPKMVALLWNIFPTNTIQQISHLITEMLGTFTVTGWRQTVHACLRAVYISHSLVNGNAAPMHSECFWHQRYKLVMHFCVVRCQQQAEHQKQYTIMLISCYNSEWVSH